MASPLTRLMDDFFAQVVQELGTHGIGPSAFKTLLQLLTNHFDHGDQGSRLPTPALIPRTDLNRLLHVPASVQEARLARTGHRKYLKVQ